MGSRRPGPPKRAGVGFMEAPRGALAHWIVIKDGKIDNYQAVVPSTWNAGPRDPNGKPGPYEAALMDRHTPARPQATAGDPAHHPLASTPASPAPSMSSIPTAKN